MAEIYPEDELLRRLLRYYVKSDNSVSSAAFKDKYGKLDPRLFGLPGEADKSSEST